MYGLTKRGPVRMLGSRVSLIGLCLLAAIQTARTQGTLKTIVETGGRDVRINIVFLAEGFTAAEQSKFDLAASTALDAMLSNSFYAQYSNFFNAYSVFVPSNQSGADHPATGTYVDTYFNSSFGSFGVERLLTIPPNDVDPNYNDGVGKVIAVLSNLLPDYNIVLLLVNDATYGGSGGEVAVVSTNLLSTEIAIHELGHSLAHLGDEYSDPLPGYPDTEEPNTTTQTISSLVKWRHWFNLGIPIPTPQIQQFASVVGLFPGAHYHALGWYRPQLDCKMRTLGARFCKVCLETGALSFYRLSPPIDSFSPLPSLITLSNNESQQFALTIKLPEPPLSVQWAVDGRTLPNETAPVFTLNAMSLQPGPHTVATLVRDVSGRIRTDPQKKAQETHNWEVDVNGPTPLSQPMNISTRAGVQTGDQVTIGGFIITGTTPKRLVIRALGPSLQPYGVTNVLLDPELELHGPNGSLITSNNDWRSSQSDEIMTSGYAPGSDLESAFIVTLPAGAYTAILRGHNATTGVGLIEIYDLDPAADSQLVNISTRGLVQNGEQVMIGGFILGGASGGSRVVIRAMGPSLTSFGVTGALSDPTLALYNSSGTRVASNNNWQDTQRVAIQATGLAPADDREAAIMTILPPGAYTAIVHGSNNITGVSLVEVYNLDSYSVSP